MKTNLIKSANKIGAHIKEISVAIDHSLPWKEAIMQAGPDTESDYDVLKVSNLYPAEQKVSETKELVFLNFKNGNGSYEKAAAWGKENGLTPSTPQDIFEFAIKNPDLEIFFGKSRGYIVETTGCMFDGDAQACHVYWNDANRKAYLYWQAYFGYAYAWFAFCKSSPSPLEPETLDTLSFDLRLKKVEKFIEDLKKL